MNYESRIKKETVGVDVGNGTTSSISVELRSGISEVKDSQIAEHSAVIDGATYVFGESTWPYKVDRTKNVDCKNLTLYITARELLTRNLPPGDYDITLGVGLPFQHWSALKGNLKAYYQDGKKHSVHIDGKTYTISFTSVAVMAQAYSALVDNLSCLKGRTVMLADIGDGTLDVILFEDAVPKETDSFTEDKGVKTCFSMAKRNYKGKTQKELSRNTFEQVIRGQSRVSNTLENCINQAAKEYCKSVYNSLVEGGYDEDAMSLIIMGGGANIVKAYGDDEFSGAEFLLDTKANAKGYEAFMRKYQEKIGG